MNIIGNSVAKVDHNDKISGHIKYVGDYPSDELLTGRVLRSSKPHAKILDVILPEMPEGYYYVNHEDVPGENYVSEGVIPDTPIFAADEVKYIGDPIGVVVGPDKKEVERLLKQIEVVYEDLPVVNSLDDATEAFFDYSYTKGDPDKAFEESDYVLEESFATGAQEQAYLECQGMISAPDPETGGVYVHGSMQCPYYLVSALEIALGIDRDKIRVRQDATGGGFGGKEDYPSVLACQTAVAALKTGKPVRIVLPREEDMMATSKKHPAKMTFKVGIKDGKLHAIDADLKYDAGAYSTLSMVVLQRGVITAPAGYRCDNIHVRGRALATNTVPNGAYRGFGGPQSLFGMERIMDHAADELGLDRVQFKLDNLAVQGDTTSTEGIYHFHVPYPEMTKQLYEASDFERKREEYSKPQTGRYRRGIGLGYSLHGGGFTGTGERDLIKATVKMRKDKDNKVHIMLSQADIGQGFLTTLPKIAAEVLEIPLEDIIYTWPDTKFDPDSGPTVASRSMMSVGGLIYEASQILKDKWVDGEEIEIEHHYTQPDWQIPFTIDGFKGDAYPCFSFATYVIEVEVDTLTGVVRIPGAWASFDAGTPIDLNILTGQMEGGFLQSIGYSAMEQIPYDDKCRIRNNHFSDYLIPTAKDVPNMHVYFCPVEYPAGPFGAKGAGELPATGAPSAYLSAVEQAVGGTRLFEIPLTQEMVLNAEV